jgi:3',5'-cyclic AMP phosphodiesterase CpdA
VIAQVSDTHVGGPHTGSEERLAAAIADINAMTRQPDLVLFTGDLTHGGTAVEWDEFQRLVSALDARWDAIRGNHDHHLPALGGHRVRDAGPLRLVLLDSSSEEFTDDDAAWLDTALGEVHRPTVIAIHHPPFETGIWWMDCVGLHGLDRFESVVRRHPHVLQVLSGHVHRPIVTAWGGCTLWVSPSTSVPIAVDLDPEHAPAESLEPPMISLHAYVNDTVVSHIVPVGATAQRRVIDSPAFVAGARDTQRRRTTAFA